MPVQFNEQEFSQQGQTRQGGQGLVTKAILGLGLAKSASQANIVMLIVALIAAGLAVFFFRTALAG